MIQTPITPKLPAHLDIYELDIDEHFEIDQSRIVGGDFSNSISMSIDASSLENTDFTGLTFQKFEITDSTCKGLEAAALQIYKGQLVRVTVFDSRFTGADFAESKFTDCTFKNSKFDTAGFRFSNFHRVRFEDCVLTRADFSNAKFKDVVFTGCDMDNTSFAAASCINVDLTNENISGVKGLLGLKGSTISNEQLIQIAPFIANELGFLVAD